MQATVVAVACGVLLAGSLAAIGTVSYLHASTEPGTSSYAIVVDAGSTHSDFMIYSWEPTGYNVTSSVFEYPDSVIQKPFECERPGISDYAANPPEAATVLRECLVEATAALPSGAVASTPVLLRATAGMRVLREDNPQATDAILTGLTNMFRAEGFSTLSSAEILTGSAEGAFGWVTVNYIAGNIQPKTAGFQAAQSLGALDLGGASTQITFVPESFAAVEPENKFELYLYGERYDLYTHSYLCYGQRASTDRITAQLLLKDVFINPCLPRGYVQNVTAGEVTALNASFCTDATPLGPDRHVDVLISGGSDAEACANAMVDLVTDPARGPVKNATATGDFLGFSAYYYPVDFVCGLWREEPGYEWCKEHKPTMGAYQTALMRLCAMDLAELQNVSSAPEDRLVNYCLQGMLGYTLLARGYGFGAASDQVTFIHKVEGQSVGWTLGMILNETNLLVSPQPQRRVSTPTFIGVLAAAVIALLVGVAMGAFLLSQRKRDGYRPLSTNQ